MLTYPSREAVVAAAIGRWLRGNNKVTSELLVVLGPNEDMDLPLVPGMRVVRSPSKHVAIKFETGFLAAKGDVVAKMDDDDWYSPDRLWRQAQAILEGGADISSLQEEHMVYLPEKSWWKSLHHHENSYHDATTAVRRDIVAKTPWPRWVPGETFRWVNELLRLGAKHTILPANEDFVYVRHQSNTWQIPDLHEHFEPVERPAWCPEEDLKVMAEATASMKAKKA
jgi:Glycosyl transferase family 2